ncbi:SNF1-interacting protein [Coelomomyces lativittatus]|nr:SNF1-interacting protein [Coelomomyces lativittatus]
MGSSLSKRDPERESLNQYTTPTGLYPQCNWDVKTIRKLVLSRKLAPLFPGTEDAKEELEECPICFLYYPGGLNRSNCCKKGLCSGNSSKTGRSLL